MSDSRREVRATQAFFEELDSELGDERGPNGDGAVELIAVEIDRY